MADAQPIRALANVVAGFPQLQTAGSGNGNLKFAFLPKFAFLNAQPVTGTRLAEPQFSRLLVGEQPFRPQYLELKRARMRVEPDLSAAEHRCDTGFEACLVATGKFRSVNENMLLRAKYLTRRGGMIFVAGAKNTGIASTRKRIAKIHDDVDSLSKYHSMVFWFANSLEPGANPDPQTHHIVNADNRTYRTMPGLFSANRVDPGSRLLASHFGERIAGNVADLGAGWGYLSAQLLTRSENITGLDLYEAHWHGVDSCKHNLSILQDHRQNSVEAKVYWHDVVGEPIAAKYDWVIMNPPFHAGRRPDLELGQSFIRKAASILKPGGQLAMVANQHLAYEAIVGSEFTSFRVLEEARGFKVIAARK